MKILHIIDSTGVYGAEVVLLNLMEAQLEMGFNPVLGSIGTFSEGQKILEIVARQKDLSVVEFRMNRGYSISGAFRIVRFAREQGMDLLHSHSYKSNILLGSLPKFVRNVPLVVTLHGWTATRVFSKIWLYSFMDLLCLRRADAVVFVNSNGGLKWKSRFLIGISTFVVENGIPELNFSLNSTFSEDYRIRDFCKNSFVIGSIGRLSEEKGWEKLIDALNYLVTRDRDYKVVIVGEGSEQSSLEKKIRRYGLSDRVYLTGYQKNAFQYIPLFDIFILPSLTEGLPVTLLEAMQAKVPIVATKVGGVPHLLGNGQYGMLVEPGQPKALAGAISYLRDNPGTARAMSRKARAVALAKYSNQRMAKDYHNVYERVPSKRGHRTKINA